MTFNPKSKIYITRFLGSFSLGLAMVMAPFFVFKLTNSVSMTALAIVAEFIPQIFLYTAGGSFLSYFTPRLVHLWMEAIRVLAVLIILISAYFGFAIPILIAAGIMSLTGCIINIINESLVHHHWKRKEMAEGYSLITNATILGKTTSFLFALIPLGALNILAAGLISQMLILYIVHRYSNEIYIGYARKSSGKMFSTIIKKTIISFKALDKGHLKLAFMSSMMWLPSATFISFLPFILNASGAVYSVEPSTIASMRLLMQLSAFAVSAVSVGVISRSVINPSTLALFAVVCTLMSIGFLSTHPEEYVVVGMVMCAASYFMYPPWAKATRQKIIKGHQLIRHSITGMMIGFESSASLVGAFIVAIFEFNFVALGITFSGLIVLSGLLWILHQKESRLVAS